MEGGKVERWKGQVDEYIHYSVNAVFSKYIAISGFKYLVTKSKHLVSILKYMVAKSGLQVPGSENTFQVPASKIKC